MSERLRALFCIGCGRVDVPQSCVGACDERLVDLVFARDHDVALLEVAKLDRAARMLREVVLQLVSALPAPSSSQTSSGASGGPEVDWEETRQTLQTQARSALRETTNRAPQEPDVPDEVDRITAWRCLTCGWTEAPRECLGVCVRNPVEMVPATEYDELRARADYPRRQLEALGAVVRQFAWVRPRAGESERTWQALQAHGRAALAHDEKAVPAA
jgi:hypothetical protein